MYSSATSDDSGSNAGAHMALGDFMRWQLPAHITKQHQTATARTVERYPVGEHNVSVWGSKDGGFTGGPAAFTMRVIRTPHRYWFYRGARSPNWLTTNLARGVNQAVCVHVSVA
ncbi:hypothetical protein SAMD00023353_0100610 [Rosellinia necatrix]|uniref:Uncharacterized protein n=1 Tax=Rosellinia necatrix TaxID=77044 RepID=A0A1S8A4J4_ROSNE|nr:hypothetical protein SAMD00023353_0100610 [Rosellinia necatrix]